LIVVVIVFLSWAERVRVCARCGCRLGRRRAQLSHPRADRGLARKM